MSTSDFLVAVGVIVSCLSALLSAHYSKKSLTFSEQAEGSAKEANQHSKHSNVISANVWIDQYLCNVRLWSDESCECISRATHAIKLNKTERDKEFFEVMYRLSSLIDRGRWFFPNLWNEEIGVDKEPAYRGLRQPVLDHLVDAYDLIASYQRHPADEITAQLVRCQRIFVSEVQQVLNPRRREKEISRVDEQFAISEKLADFPNVVL